MNTNILNKLENAQEMIPDEHDGSYELMRATINAYRGVDEEMLDYFDLNTVYLMAIGTWKHGVPVKKKSVERSHLSQESKLVLTEVLDKIHANSTNDKYSYKERPEPGTFGMFGTGLFSFQNKTNKKSVSSFIKMCIDISNMTDDNEMFLRAETVLNNQFRGMKAAAASVVLHCLKPNTFPVLNSNMGYESIFEALGIPLTRKGDIDTYIQNCRSIKAFRDANLPIKNYRIFDLAARELETEDKAVVDLIRLYKQDFVNRDDQERYKWQAIRCFKDNWKIEEKDFAKMLEQSLAETKNLLASRSVFAKDTIIKMSRKDPEAVREMFANLYDENTTITERIEAFRLRAHDLYQKIYENTDEEKKQHQQSIKAIATYLFLNYPEKYYLYQHEKFKTCASRIGCDAQIKIGDVQNIPAYYDMCERVLNAVKKDKELQEISKIRLDSSCYQDPEFHMLTDDVVYYAYITDSDTPVKTDEDDEEDEIEVNEKVATFNKNIILYGPPGTGKTYSVIQYAVAIIEEKSIEDIKKENYGEVFARYLKHRDDTLVEFTTFHQSFGYEEFIEGIRPVVDSEAKGESKGEIRYEIRDGVFKDFCDKAGSPIGGAADVDLGIGKSPTVWKVSLGGTGENPCRSDCMRKDHIRIGWDEYGEILTELTDYSKNGGKVVLNAFYNNMQIGDLVLSCYSSRTIDAIGVIVGEPEWHDEYSMYKRLRRVRWLAKGINEDIFDLNAGKTMVLSTVYKLSVTLTDALQILRRVNPSIFTVGMKVPNRVFIIDEINRGNISKIFGELITLIESSKRIGTAEELRSSLPYSGKKFGVPENVYIIGTMNTADRSIALIDTALRRRFDFVEMQPDSNTLEGILVEGIDISAMLETMNKRITVLHDREHTIGHSFFLGLRNAPTLGNLASIFKHKIIPLLQEYFFDDYEKIRMVLGDNQKKGGPCFIVEKNDVKALFDNSEMDLDGYFEISNEAFTKVEAYAFLQ